MPDIQRLWLAVLTHNKDDSGTKDRPVLIINQVGTDVVNHTFPAPPRPTMPFGGRPSVMPRGEAELFVLILDDPNDVSLVYLQAPNATHVRIGLAGSDLWQPQHILVWGSPLNTDTYNPYTPIAAAIDLPVDTHAMTLSIDPDEGLSSIPLAIMLPQPGMSIERLAVLLVTEDTEDAGTDDTIELVTDIAGTTTVYPLPYPPPDTAQEDLERGATNLYMLPVDRPFRVRDLQPGSITLRTTGDDAWHVKHIFIFGFDTPSGQPRHMVALVHEFPWTGRPFSTDPSEGVASVELNLASI